jgi:hypothetical protein
LADDVSLVKNIARIALPAPTCERDDTIRRKYGHKVYAGMSVMIQVVGRRFEDEKVVDIVKMTTTLLNDT